MKFPELDVDGVDFDGDRSGSGFLRDVTALYRWAQGSKLVATSIWRARAHSVASLAEDVFARHLSVLLPADCSFWVDSQLTRKHGRSRDKIAPDIVVLDASGEVRDLLDLKLDLGWKRGSEQQLIDRNGEWLEKAKRNAPFAGVSGDRVQIAEDAKYHICVVTACNSGSMRFENSQSCHLWVFADQHWHPNKKFSYADLMSGEQLWSVDEHVRYLGKPRSDFARLVDHLCR